MSVTHKDLHSWLSQQTQSANSEIDYRILVGRYYYCAYHKALEDLDKIIPTDFSGTNGRHSEICFHLKKDKNNRSISTVGWKLDALRKLRNDADYHFHLSFPKSQLDRARADAITCMKEIDRAAQKLNSK